MQDSSTSKLVRLFRSDLLRSNVILGFFVLITLVFVLHLWHWSPSVPLSMGGDNSFYLMVINNISRGHWLLSNKNLGAPTGQTLYDFPPVGEFLHYAYIYFLALVTRSTGATESIFYFTTFFSAAIASNITSRRIGLGRNLSIALAILFAFLPYHFIKNVQHLMLSSYFVLPLIVYAALEILKPRVELSKRRRLTTLVILGVLAGGTGIYYAIFSIFIVTTTGMAFFLSQKNRKEIVKNYVLYMIALFATLIVSALPTLVYGMKNGFYDFQRSFSDVEYYGLKIANLFRPIVDHRIGFFRTFSNSFGPSYIPGEPVEMLGVAGSIGLIVLLIYAMRKIASHREAIEEQDHKPLIATVVIVSLLFSTVGSFNSIFYVLGMNQIRVWARITPLIAFCALVFGGLVLENLLKKRTSIRPYVQVGLLALFVLAGIYDQTSSGYIPHYQENSFIWNREELFTRAADRIFPAGSMIYQYPSVVFPENGPTLEMADYAQAFPFIHGSELFWSYGNIKTRPSAFHEKAATLSGNQLLTFIQTSKFSGLHITKRAVKDRGESLIAAATARGARVVYTSPDDAEILLDLRDMK